MNFTSLIGWMASVLRVISIPDSGQIIQSVSDSYGNRPWTPPAGLNVSYISPIDETLPNVMIFTTGGTIASKGSSRSDSGVYLPGSGGVKELVEAVPEVLNVSNIYGADIANVISFDITPTLLLNMSHWGEALLCAPDSIFDALIVTHGTDSLDETAFFLDLTINCGKPVILTGAMRPSTAISADGPANFYASVKTGVHPDSRGRGGLIVLNDRIGSAFYTQKTHMNYVDTFKAPEPGYLGGLFNNEPFYYYDAAVPKFKVPFDVTNVTDLPRVDILYGYQDMDSRLYESIMDYGDVKGIILANPKGGTTSQSAIEKVISSGIPIIRHHRINVGLQPPDQKVEPLSMINSGLVNSHKSRIQLQLALATGADPRDVFERVMRETLYG